MTQPVLDIADLTFEREGQGRRFRLEVPELRLAPGAFLALAGESGSGKSTLLDILGLILAPQSAARFALTGRDGETHDIAARLAAGGLDGVADIRRSALGYVLQQGGLLPFLTVRENLEITRRPDREPPIPVTDLAERLGIAQVLKSLPDRISIGQRQRVAIGRAVMSDPDLILADEPTASLDPPMARATLDLLCELVRERGLAVIMASHSWALVAEFGFDVLAARVSAGGNGSTATFLPGMPEGLAA